ncbi:MAG: hypothetical protein ACI8UO_004637 [Verrucomicrobiales bacterium]|jgi:hypothetical protein
MNSRSNHKTLLGSQLSLVATALAGILAIFSLPASVFAQEIPTPIETNPSATSEAVGEIVISESEALPPTGEAAEAVSTIKIAPTESDDTAVNSAGDESSAIASIEIPGIPKEPESKVIVVRSQVPEPLVNVNEEHRGLPAVKKTGGRVYLVLPDSGIGQASALASAPQISDDPEPPAADPETVEGD